MDYRIETKVAFTVMGKKRSINLETSYQDIPKFWEEHIRSGENSIVCGMFGLCLESDGKYFDYLIADNYVPWKEVPEGYVTRTIPSNMWALFPCKLGTLQEINTKMWKEWLPNCKENKLGGNYNVELYGPPSKDGVLL